MTIQTKQALRQRMLDIIQSQKEEDALRKSRAIGRKIFELPVFVRARAVMFYVSFKGEVDTLEVMARAIEVGKKVVVPGVCRETKEIIPFVVRSMDELHTGTYGILEPRMDAERAFVPEGLDLVLVPGVAFDHENNRLGRGAGYYDRFLAKLPENITTVGLAYDFQIVDHLPDIEPHDKPVSFVLSN